MAVLLAIPTYRCAAQITRVLQALIENQSRLHAQIQRVLVIDNNSDDDTGRAATRVIELAQRQDWIWVVRNQRNYGLGGTHKVAFTFAKQQGFEQVIVLHGDDQASVTDLPLILKGLEQGHDAVLGARFAPGSKRQGYSWLRTSGNIILNGIYSLLTGRSIQDLGSGLNGFQLKTIDFNGLNRLSNQFTFNMDLLLDLCARRKNIAFVPIHWRETDQVSNARTFRVGWQALLTIVCWRLGWSCKEHELEEMGFVRIGG